MSRSTNLSANRSPVNPTVNPNSSVNRRTNRNRRRWLAPWKDSAVKPAIYHCISRIVDRRFVLKDIEREKFRTFMRMQENFSGCRVLSYCLMSNHIHLLLEVPPMPEGGLSDEELLKRLSATSTEAFVAEVAKELAKARENARTAARENPDPEAAEAASAAAAATLAAIHARFTYRMHNLSEFMKTLLQRFTRWFNRTHERSGTLWEERYKSVIVEDGIAARTMAAYIDLNPVRAGMVTDPAEYRWSSYGEAVGGGPKGNGKKARAGLVRACMSHHGAGFEAEKWKEISRIYRRTLGLALGRKSGHAEVEKAPADQPVRPPMNSAEALEAKDNGTVLPDLGYASMLRQRVRYFTDGAVIGSKSFVNEVFTATRHRFPASRKDGARRLKGSARAAAGELWSLRDLRVRV